MSVAKEEIRQIVIEKTLSVTDVYSPLKELYASRNGHPYQRTVFSRLENGRNGI